MFVEKMTVDPSSWMARPSISSSGRPWRWKGGQGQARFWPPMAVHGRSGQGPAAFPVKIPAMPPTTAVKEEWLGDL